MPISPGRPSPSPVLFLATLSFVNMIGFAGWQALFNNFAREQAGFGWLETGLTQTIREVPGFLAFTALFWLMFFREQTVAYVSLALLATGVLLTGYFPSLTGIIVTTIIMSVGFHYFETVNQSLQLQLLPKDKAPQAMGQIASAGAVAQFTAFGGVAGLAALGMTSETVLFLIVGLVALALTAAAIIYFPRFEGPVVQRKQMIVRPRYGLYYALTFMSGARRQIFSAFGAFLLVDRFGFAVSNIALLYLVTALGTALLASRLGRLVNNIGERRTMILENIVLICVFSGYALTQSPIVAAALFVVDGVSMTLMIAQRTYFQKIADPADMAGSAGVAFTINHIAAVVIPVTFGLLGMGNPSRIFWLGALIATCSLTLAVLVPVIPRPGRETVLSPAPSPAPGE
jgi:predicted MFS family arabinose efflux permease